MGQQQLLLLVLSTVIVGLATVAGIQAFDEGQTQAKQDALTQRALQIGNDVYAATQKPSQLGGVSTSDGASAISAAAGYDGDTDGISAKGAGSDADCAITSTDPVKIVCSSDGANSSSSSNEAVTVTVNDAVNVTSINGTSVTQ